MIDTSSLNIRLVQDIQDNLPQNPIFIVGAPRSGTTLLQALLYTQPNIVSFPETHVIHYFLPRITDSNGNVDLQVFRRTYTAEFEDRTQIFLSSPYWDYLEFKASQSSLTGKVFFEFVVSIFLAAEPQPLPSGYRWLEKTPAHIYHLETILQWYPHAHIINIIRNPFATIASQYFKLSKHAQQKNLPMPTLGSLGKSWNKAVEQYEFYQKQYPQNVIGVQYEQFVANPVATLQKICNFCGIPFNRDLLRQYKSKSQTVRHQWETWKSDVDSAIQNTNEKSIAMLNTRQKLYVQGIVRKNAQAYNYALQHPIWIQKVYAFYVRILRLLSRIPLFPSSLKRTFHSFYQHSIFHN